LPHLLADQGEVLVATRCPACGKPLAWNVGSGRPPDGTQVAHFLVPAPRMWDDVVHTCRNQRLFCAEDCVDTWLAATGSDRGYVMDLGTLWRLAAHWYDGRLEPGYIRREPSQAASVPAQRRPVRPVLGTVTSPAVAAGRPWGWRWQPVPRSRTPVLCTLTVT
jgi:hypothetical protein